MEIKDNIVINNLKVDFIYKIMHDDNSIPFIEKIELLKVVTEKDDSVLILDSTKDFIEKEILASLEKQLDYER